MSLADLMMVFFRKKSAMPKENEALAGREDRIVIGEPHRVLKTSMMPEFPQDTHVATFAMGCFWGVEKLFWQQKGVYATAVGYCGGFTVNPTYEEVCSGKTGHAEVVQVVYWPNLIKYQQLLQLFWGNHNPTQGMQQGNDRGTQYRSAIFVHSDQQRTLAEASLEQYQQQLQLEAKGDITTEICEGAPFYYAEAYHQQYLVKNPDGYCNMQTHEKSGLPSPELSWA